MSIASIVLEYVKEHPGCARSEIVAAVGLGGDQISNALFQLSRRGDARCEFAGRFSKWHAASRGPTMVCAFPAWPRAGAPA